MINIYLAFAILWVVVLILYFFGWSDLCVPLNKELLIFIIFMIITSFIFGKILKKDLRYFKLSNNPHKKRYMIVILIILYILTFIFNKNIPLLLVLTGTPYYAVNTIGLPHLNLIISSVSICYFIYLIYIYSCFKERRTLFEIICIILYFTLMVQRQNLFICIIVFANIFLLSKKIDVNFKRHFIRNIILFLILTILGSYIFGVIGNARYGSKWKWNDSSMISTLGKMNDKYPKVLPKETFWAYIYITSPLSNLNYNIINYKSNNQLYPYLMEFLPEYISNKFNFLRKDVYLPVSSLNASTSYVRSYFYGGVLGMYGMYIIQMMCSFIVIFIAKRNKSVYFIPICMIVAYFLLFSFFENMFYYSISSMCIVIAYLMALFLKEGENVEEN